MKTSSAKNKGRTLQKYIVAELLNTFPTLTSDDCSSRSMGAGGEDILLSHAARQLIPLSFEAKNTEKINIWAAYEQAKENAKNWEPVVVFKRNRQEPLVCIDFKYFMSLLKKGS